MKETELKFNILAVTGMKIIWGRENTLKAAMLASLAPANQFLCFHMCHVFHFSYVYLYVWHSFSRHNNEMHLQCMNT